MKIKYFGIKIENFDCYMNHILRIKTASKKTDQLNDNKIHENYPRPLKFKVQGTKIQFKSNIAKKLTIAQNKIQDFTIYITYQPPPMHFLHSLNFHSL